MGVVVGLVRETLGATPVSWLAAVREMDATNRRSLPDGSHLGRLVEEGWFARIPKDDVWTAYMLLKYVEMMVSGQRRALAATWEGLEERRAQVVERSPEERWSAWVRMYPEACWEPLDS